jgi:hypothetical protein
MDKMPQSKLNWKDSNSNNKFETPGFVVLNILAQTANLPNGKNKKGEFANLKHTVELINTGYFNSDGNEVRFNLNNIWYNFTIDKTNGAFIINQDDKMLSIPVSICKSGSEYMQDENTHISQAKGKLEVSLKGGKISVKIPDLEPIKPKPTLNWRDS